MPRSPHQHAELVDAVTRSMSQGSPAVDGAATRAHIGSRDERSQHAARRRHSRDARKRGRSWSIDAGKGAHHRGAGGRSRSHDTTPHSHRAAPMGEELRRRASPAADDTAEVRLRGQNALSAASVSPAEGPVSAHQALDRSLDELLKAITPTLTERERRMNVLRDVARSLESVGLQVTVYGSLSTGLLIPSSDIDCIMTPLEDADAAQKMPFPLQSTMKNLAHAQVLTTRERKASFSAGVRVVANAMRRSRDFRGVLSIAHARVPIVKCQHRSEDVKVDLSFEKDGVVSSKFLCEEFRRPGNELARPLIVLVKALIAGCGLDDPSVGGLGSFPISMMALWFLQTKVAVEYPAELRNSLGVLLLGFLTYYCGNFDYERCGIDYCKRATFPRPRTNQIFVTNPVRPGTNCAGAATLYASRVLPAFAAAAADVSGALDKSASKAKMEGLLTRLFGAAIPACRDWSEVRQAAANYRAHPQHSWDPETHVYTGGLL